MRLNFSSYTDSYEIRQILEKYLPLTKSTVSDVKAFLKEQEINYGSIAHQKDRALKPINPNVDNLTTQEYNSSIICKLPYAVCPHPKSFSLREKDFPTHERFFTPRPEGEGKGVRAENDTCA